MSFSSASGGSASVGSTAPSSLFTDEEARFMRDSFTNLQESFDPFQLRAPGFKVPSVLPPSAVAGLPPPFSTQHQHLLLQQHHNNSSRSSLSSSLAHGSDTTIGRSIPLHSSTSISASSPQGAAGSAGQRSPSTPTISYDKATPGSTTSPPANHSPSNTTSPPGGGPRSDAIALARLKNAESWERNAVKQHTFFDPSWWSSAQRAQDLAPASHGAQQQQLRPQFSAQQRSASDLRATNVSPNSMDTTTSSHSRSSSALDALMMGIGPSSHPGPPLSAPPADPYADLLHLQDSVRSGQSPPDAGPSSSHGPRLTSAPSAPQDGFSQMQGSNLAAGMRAFPHDDGSASIGPGPRDPYFDLYNVRDYADQARKQRAAGTGWAPPPQLMATLQRQQQQQQHSQPLQAQMQGTAPLGQAQANQHHQMLFPHQQLAQGAGIHATSSGAYGQDKAWQMEQLNNLRIEREKWAAAQGMNASAADQQQQGQHPSLGNLNEGDGDTIMNEQVNRSNPSAHGAFNIPTSGNVEPSQQHARLRSVTGNSSAASQHQATSPTGPINASSPQGQPIPPSGHLSSLGLSMSTSHTFPNKAAHASPGDGSAPPGNGVPTEYAGSPASAGGSASTPGASSAFRITASALSPQSPSSGGNGGGVNNVSQYGASGVAAIGGKRGRDSSFSQQGMIPGPSACYYSSNTQHGSAMGNGIIPHPNVMVNGSTMPAQQQGYPGVNGSGGVMDPSQQNSRPILSLSKSRNRTASISASSNQTPVTPTAPHPQGGSRLASTFATRRAPLVRPPRQEIKVDLDRARGAVPDSLNWAFFTRQTSDRNQAHVDGIVDLRAGPVAGEGETASGPGLVGKSDQADESTGNASSGKKAKQGHVLLTEAEKKANHIASEQKRRANIRKGYEMLCEIVPPLKEALEREAAGKDGPGGGGGGDLDEEDEDGEEGGAGNGKGKKKRKTKKRDPETAGCEIGGERIDGRAGPRSEAIVLMKSIEYLRDLLEIHRDLNSRRDHARYQAALMCGVDIATYLGPLPPPADSSYSDTQAADSKANDDAMQH
ncbi:hypothetical protein OC845_004209 [Tilletia horrida]|nr:hypothetical protein OC845_004209 [Tilletia horrida]